MLPMQIVEENGRDPLNLIILLIFGKAPEVIKQQEIVISSIGLLQI